MARGGYRKPKTPQGPSGPGRFSKRTDATQPIQRPDLDQPDIEYGDVEASAEAQRMNPIPRGQGTRVAAQAAQARPQGGQGLPPWLFEQETAFPTEPGTEGLSTGPGAGPEALSILPQAPDEKEQVLQWLAIGMGNQDAARMLNDYRNSQAQVTPEATPGVAAVEEAAPEALPVEGLAASPAPQFTPIPQAPETEAPASLGPEAGAESEPTAPGTEGEAAAEPPVEGAPA